MLERYRERGGGETENSIAVARVGTRKKTIGRKAKPPRQLKMTETNKFTGTENKRLFRVSCCWLYKNR